MNKSSGGKLTAAILTFAAACVFSVHAEIMISEICPKPSGYDPNGFESGWIELYNSGDTAVDLSGYTLDRFNRGKAVKAGTYLPLPSISVPAGGYQVVYTCEDYPASVNDGKTPFVTNSCVVVPFKISPKKYPMIRLLKGSDVLETFVVPVELDNNKSFAPAGGAFASYATSSAMITAPAAVSRVILPTPTKGTANNMTGAIPYGPNAGPLYGVKHSLSDWYAFTPATNGAPYDVEMMINPLSAAAGDAIVSVSLIYRAFDVSDPAPTTIAMSLDRTDATGGAYYRATIPASDIPAAGHLVQWAAIVTDANGNQWRAPSFASQENGYQWYGTIVNPTAEQLSATLPTWHIFANQDCIDNMDKQVESITSTFPYGVHCGIYDSQTGLYYDNVRIDLRGNTTANLSKKSHALKFLKCQPLTCTNPFDNEKIEVRKTSMLADYSDPSRLRSCLSYYFRRQAGQDVPFCYPIRTQLNGAFYQLCYHNNRFTDELFEDYFDGYDPMGRVFKNCGNCDGLFSGGSVEQQMPDPDDYPNYVSEFNAFKSSFVNYVKKNHPSQSGMTAADQTAVDKIVVQKFDLPCWLNFLALSRITQEGDDGWSALNLYYDANRTGTWGPFAYDVHQSFGAYYWGDGYCSTKHPWSNEDNMKCHPYYGGMRVVTGNYSNTLDRANRAYECIYQSPKFRRLMARRLRTIMDQILKEPGTSKENTPFWNSYASQLATAMAADDALDRAKWGLGTSGQLWVWSSSLTFEQGVADLWDNYIVPRRVHLFNTHSVTNTAFSGAGYGAEYNAMLPLAQSPIEDLTNGFSIVNVNLDGSFSDTEKVIIRNDNNEAVDMSGWKLEGTLATTLPAGTVVDANDTITIVSDRKAYVLANDASLTDQVIIGNAAVNSATTAIALKSATGVTVAQGAEPEPTVYEGDYDEPVTINVSGEKEFNNAHFNAGLILGSGTYELKNPKGCVNTASSVTCAGTIVFKGKGTFTLSGEGPGPLMTVGDLYVSNGVFNVTYTSATAKSKAVDVQGSFGVADKGVVNVSIAGDESYGIYVANKDKTCVIDAGGTFNGTVAGTKCAALYGNKGSVDAEVNEGATVTGTLTGPQARLFKFDGGIKIRGGDVDVTGDNSAVTSKVFRAEKNIKVSGGDVNISVPGDGSEIFSSEKAVEISGGTLELASADDCISAETGVTISGGKLYGMSTGNDVIDSNADITISDGVVLAYTTATEDDGNGSFGLDVNEGNSIDITGGIVVALGGKDAHVYGSPTGYLAQAVSSATYSGKYLSITGETETAITALTVQLPAIEPNKCSLLVYAPGVSADSTPVLGDTAPETGSINFHEVYVDVQEVIPPGPPPPDPSNLGDYLNLVQLTVGDSVTAEMANVPVLVKLSENNPVGFHYADCRPDGSDLRFGDADFNAIPHEIDTWDPNGESLIWIRPSSFAAGDVINLVYNGEPAAAVNPAGVWSGYTGVWHLNETTDPEVQFSIGTYPNSTAVEGIDGNLSTYSIPNQAGRFGKCFKNNDFVNDKGANYNFGGVWVNDSGTDSPLDCGGTFTISGWFKHGNFNYFYDHIFYKRAASSNSGTPNGAFAIELGSTAATAYADARGNSGGSTKNVAYPVDMKDTWTYLTFVYEGNKVHVYQNGVFVLDSAIAEATNNDSPLVFGNNCNIANGAVGDASWCGWIDEVRLVDDVKSADWVAAEYAAMTGSVLEYGEVQNLPHPAPMLTEVSSHVYADYVEASAMLALAGGEATMADISFAYGTDPDNLGAFVAVESDVAVGNTVTKTLKKLVPETTYYFAFKAVNTEGAEKTVTGSFTTMQQREKVMPVDFGDFSCAIEFTTSGYTGESELENYPVLVKLSESKIGGFTYSEFTSNDGSDIRFADAAGNLLSHEIVSWNPNGESEIWVKVPSVTSSTKFTMYYGGTPDAAVTPTATWSGYTGVWHMEEAFGTIADATGHGLTATPSGTAANKQMAEAGAVGKARVNAASTAAADKAYLSIPDYNSFGLGSTFTLSGWVKLTACTAYPRVFSRKRSYTDTNGWEMEMKNGSMTQFSARGAAQDSFSGEFAPSLSAGWSQIVFVYDDTQLSVYQNGALVHSGAVTPATDNGYPLSFGSDSDGSETHAVGSFDEMRLWDGCASADLIKADYDQIAGSGFLVASSVKAVIAGEPYFAKPVATVDFESATASAVLSGVGEGAETAAVSFAYGTDPANLGAPAPVASAVEAGDNVATNLTNLAPGTTYYFEFTAVNDAEDPANGSVAGSFTTKAYGAPEVTSEFQNDPEHPTVVATVTDVGDGCSSVDVYFTYGPDPDNLPAFTPIRAGLAAGGTATASITEFESGVTTAYRWMAVNDHSVTNYATGSFTPGIDFRRPDTNVAEYSRGVKFTVTGYTGTETLTNFPVLVHLEEGKPTGFSYADFYSADGADLVFLDANGNTIAHEIDTWNPNGESLVWVQLPEMVNGTEFSMWYRSSKSGSVFNPPAMWAEYVGVWHLNETGDGVLTVADSTANGLDGVTHAKSLAQPSGIIGAARRVTTISGNAASNGRILVDRSDSAKAAAIDELIPNFTVSTWFAFRSTGAGPDYAFIFTSKDNDKDPGWGMQFNAAAGAAPGAIRIHSSGAADNQCVTYNRAISMRQWYKVDIVYSGNTYKAYYDGVQVATGNLYNNLPCVSGTCPNIAFGGMAGSGYGALNGDMDEIRLKKGASSAAWVAAEYLTQTSEIVTGGEVVVFTEKPKPIGTLALTDFGAAYAQFGGSLVSLGGEATSADIQVKVWADGESEPGSWSNLVTGVAAGTQFGGVLAGLDPVTEYSYKIRAVSDLAGANPSDVVEGAFTTTGVGTSGEGGKVALVGDDYVHTYDKYSSDFTFTVPDYVSSVELLLVGGGGAGGHTHGGGGAGGTVRYFGDFAVTPGATYTFEIGEGGIASSAVGTVGGAGGTTVLKLGDDTLAQATGGNSGGNNTTSTGAANADHTGGALNNNCGGGGAGAGKNGSNASTDTPPSGGAGGDGVANSITGTPVIYGGGGGGGASTAGTLANPSSPGSGGMGGGGNGGGGNVEVETLAEPQSGVDGLGGGGGGGAVTQTAYLKGGNGGAGFAAVRYTITGTGTGTAAPRVSLNSAVYEGDLRIKLAYRVGWAGEGADTASVKLLWGYTPTAITRELPVSAAAIGSAEFTFSAPLDEKTYYLRLEAANGDDTSLSCETLAVTVPHYDGEVPGDTQVPAFSGSASVARTDAHWADLTGIVGSLGEGAESCQIAAYIGLTDDVSMMTNQGWKVVTEGVAFTNRLVDLDLDTTYYCYLEAKNNLGAAVATPVMSFTTRSGSKLSSITTTANQQDVSLSGYVLTVGAGTTDVYISWDNQPYEFVGSYDAESASTEFASNYHVPTWKNVGYRVMCSNECTTVTDELSGEFWTDLKAGTIVLADKASYTWKADGEGNWNGDWNDPSHWEGSTPDCLGYPSNANTPVSFANCTLENPVTVTVNGKFTIGTFDCYGSQASDITFTGNGRTASQLSCGNLPNKVMKANSKLRFEDMTLLRNSGNVANWYIRQDNVTTNIDVSFSGVTMTGIGELVLAAPYSRIAFENCTTNTYTGKFSLGGTNTVAIIDNSWVSVKEFFAPADAAGTGVTLKFKGAAPVLIDTTTYFGTWSNPEDLLVEFTVPEGGYAEAPIQMQSTTHLFAKPGQASANHIVFAIAEDSPALMVTDQIENCVLVSAPAGFNLANMAEGIGTVPTNGETELGQFKYGLNGAAVVDSATAKQILLDLTGYIHEAPGYTAGDEVGGLELSTEQAAWLNDYLGGFADKAALEAAITAAASDGIGLGDKYALNLDPTTADSYSFAITGITVADTVVTVTVTLTRANGESEVSDPIRGTLKLFGTDELGTDFGESAAKDISDAFDGKTTETFEFTDAANLFFRAVVE